MDENKPLGDQENSSQQDELDNHISLSHSNTSRQSRVPLTLMIILLTILIIGGLFLLIWYIQSQSVKTNKDIQRQSFISPVVPQTIIVGTDPTFPPMESIIEGKLVGYDIDLANLITQELGMQIELKSIVFDDLFAELEQNNIDMIISTVTITDERKQKYDFSEPYLNAGQVLITRKESSIAQPLSDLQGKKIGVQKGTTIETEAKKYTSDDLIIRYPDFVQATQALINGEVDAVFTDLPNAKGITLENPDLKIASDPFTNDFYGVVFRKGDPRVEQVNHIIESLRVKGILTDLKQKWLD